MRLLPLLILLSIVSSSGADARQALVWVEVPGAREETVRSLADGGPLRWLARAIEVGAMRSVSSEDAVAIDSLRRSIRLLDTPYVDAGSRFEETAGEPILGLSASVRMAERWLDEDGGPSIAFLGAWRGNQEWTTVRRIAGIDESLRWEEVEEFLSLTPEQNRTLRAMSPNRDHPLWRMRRTYSADKLFTNLALYYGKTERAPRVFLTLEVAKSFEDDLIPWTELHLGIDPDEATLPELDRQRRFFLRRVRSSTPRVYARIDRVLQSLDAEWSGSALIVVDATRSQDPFLAFGGSLAILGSESPEATLMTLLDRAGWGQPRSP